MIMYQCYKGFEKNYEEPTEKSKMEKLKATAQDSITAFAGPFLDLYAYKTKKCLQKFVARYSSYKNHKNGKNYDMDTIRDCLLQVRFVQ